LSATSLLASSFVVACLGSAALLESQPAPAARGPALTIISRSGRQALPVVTVGVHEMVSLDALAALFDLSVREDTGTGGLTISHRNKVLVLSTTQGLASMGGRIISLSSPAVRSGNDWHVPVDLIGRALPAIADVRIDLRRASRMVIVGDLRVPRVVVSHEGDTQRAHLTIDVAPRTQHAIAQQAGRLVVAFQADALDAAIAPGGQPDLFLGARLDGTDLVVDLGPRFASFRATDAPAEGDASRIVIDLLAGALPVTPAPVTPSAPTGPATVSPTAPFETPTSALRTIVLDPGHGGDELGAKGPSGTLEKDVALAVARQLKAVLEARLGVRVLLTRDGDQTVPLDQRAAIANNNKSDLFVSLHANASVRGSVTGAEVFYLSLDEYGQDAERAADPSELLPVITGGGREIDLILWDMAQAQHLEASATFARIVEEQLRARVPMSARAIQQAPFRVLVGANMPAVLVEMGFITNATEERRLAAPDRQSEIVQALHESIVRFRGFLESGRAAAPLPSRSPQPVPGPPAPQPPAKTAGPGG
jgi:N-acetylmuramoyl-L-alanine amidase